MRMENPRLEVIWTDDFLRIEAVLDLPGGKTTTIGSIQGSVETPGIGLLSDIEVKDPTGAGTGLFHPKGWATSARRQGIGSELLEWFEHEMGTRGIGEIRGNLVPETPDKRDWLIGWYQKRGYDFHPGETAGAWAPPESAGVVSKRIPIRARDESRAVILDGGPGEP